LRCFSSLAGANGAKRFGDFRFLVRCNRKLLYGKAREATYTGKRRGIRTETANRESNSKISSSIEGVPRRVTLTIPANFMLIATLDRHPCMQSVELNLSGKGSVAT
jgi:hypothetical protein